MLASGIHVGISFCQNSDKKNFYNSDNWSVDVEKIAFENQFIERNPKDFAIVSAGL